MSEVADAMPAPLEVEAGFRAVPGRHRAASSSGTPSARNSRVTSGAPPSRRRDAPNGGASRLLVLVVEDDADVRHLLTTVLSDAGYAVAAAADGDEALRLAAARAPDAVVLDLLLPGSSGWEVAGRLHGVVGRRVPIVVATAAEYSLFQLPPEVACVVLKPFEPDTIVRAVGETLSATHATGPPATSARSRTA